MYHVSSLETILTFQFSITLGQIGSRNSLNNLI